MRLKVFHICLSVCFFSVHVVVWKQEIVVGSNMDKIYLVMDYVEHDLKSLMQYSMKKPFLMSEVKTLLLQILSGIAHLHDNWIIHRDLKTSNLLLSHKGVLKVSCDEYRACCTVRTDTRIIKCIFFFTLTFTFIHFFIFRLLILD
jgi:serine/threonine protein kinase